jgi:hypothetical protein
MSFQCLRSVSSCRVVLNENDGVVRLFFSFFLSVQIGRGLFVGSFFPNRIDFRYLVVFSRRIRKNLDNADDVIWRCFSSFIFIYLFFFLLGRWCLTSSPYSSPASAPDCVTRRFFSMYSPAQDFIDHSRGLPYTHATATTTAVISRL